MTLMVTGHRKLVPAGWTGSPWPNNNPFIQDWHRQIEARMATVIAEYEIAYRANHGNSPNFISGMAIGADTLFASAVIGVGISDYLIAAVPFAGQESKWPPASQEVYWNILNRCGRVEHVCDPGYAAWKMQARNKWMVDNSREVLAVWDGTEQGGTWNCMQYAVKKGRSIARLDPTNLELSMFN